MLTGGHPGTPPPPVGWSMGHRHWAQSSLKPSFLGSLQGRGGKNSFRAAVLDNLVSLGIFWGPGIPVSTPLGEPAPIPHLSPHPSEDWEVPAKGPARRSFPYPSLSYRRSTLAIGKAVPGTSPLLRGLPAGGMTLTRDSEKPTSHLKCRPTPPLQLFTPLGAISFMQEKTKVQGSSTEMYKLAIIFHFYQKIFIRG